MTRRFDSLRSRAALIGTIFASLALVRPSAGQDFVDATVAPLDDTGASEAGIWGDYDDDGDLDLYVTTYLPVGSNRLLRNDGGAFADVTTPLLGDELRPSIAPNWIDFDNDDDLDLFVSTLNTNRLFRNDGNLQFVDVATGWLALQPSTWGSAWADYDLDGDLDVYLARDMEADVLLRNEGDATFSQTTPSSMQSMTGRAYGLAWADYDDDGDPDLLVAHGHSGGGRGALFRNDGAGMFADITSSLPSGTIGEYVGADWGDYDNDGDLDLILTNRSDRLHLIRNDGSGSLADATPASMVPSDYKAPCWGDYDNDGDLDLFVTMGEAGPGNQLFRNDGVGAFADVSAAPLNESAAGMRSGTWGDYDGDGDLDLYVTRMTSEPNRMFRNDNSNGNHWLHIQLHGTASNRSAIGARVELWASGFIRVAEISAGSAWWSQNTLPAEFGLGAAIVADSIVVRWPSGAVTRVEDVAADQVFHLSEDGGATYVGERRAETGLSLLTYPNPGTESVRVAFTMPRQGPVRLDVVDLRGRRVAELLSGFRAAGQHSVRWNASPGSRMPAGVYFVRLTTPEGNAARKVLLTR